MRVVSLREMKEIEQKTIEQMGLSESLIIENVGIEGANCIIEKFQNKRRKTDELMFLIGSGTNGADTLAIARHLKNKDYSVRAFILFPDEMSNELLKEQVKLAKSFGVRISEIRKADDLKSYFLEFQSSSTVIDGILGTGFTAPLSNYLFDIVNITNSFAKEIISIDIASGVEVDTGRTVGAAIEANMTLGVGLPKLGYFVSNGAAHTGHLEILGAGFSKKLLNETGDKFLIDAHSLVPVLEQRNKFSHKNRFGHVLLVGGSRGLTGALQMSSRAALESGAGLVSAITWEKSYSELNAGLEAEVMSGIIPEDEEHIKKSIKKLSRFDVVVIGPGLGRGKKSREILLTILAYFKGPVIIDADAIRELSFDHDARLLRARTGPTFLTPHLGEFSAFMNLSLEQISSEPIKVLRKAVGETGCSFIVKSACTFCAYPNGTIHINYFPNDGMATGGTGDVLAGLLGGTLAQYLPPSTSSSLFRDLQKIYDASSLAILTHTLAGKYAAKSLGTRSMKASSIIDHFPKAYNELYDKLSSMRFYE